jgi:CelD/BcsL family acetyltransferase involved in cellulose biosynthesis
MPTTRAGFDPGWSQRSAGLVLLGRTVRDAIEEGAMEYDLLAGGDAYKRRFETGLREARTLVVTPRFHPARAAAAVGVGARRLARRLLVTRP